MKPKGKIFAISIIILVILLVYVGSYLKLTRKTRSSLGAPGSPPIIICYVVNYPWMPSWAIQLYRPLIAIEGMVTGERMEAVYLRP